VTLPLARRLKIEWSAFLIGEILYDIV